LPSCKAFAVEVMVMFFEGIITLTVEFLKTAGAIFVFDSLIMEFFEIILEAIRSFGM
jgi:hypothetical protein